MAAAAASTAALGAFMAASRAAGLIVAGFIAAWPIAAAPIVVELIVAGLIVAESIAVAVRSSSADAPRGDAVMAGLPAERSPPEPPSAS